jgi:hypothetical protein
MFNPPSIQNELELRLHISNSMYDLSPIIVVDKIPSSKIFIELDAKVYEDTKTSLMVL